MDLARARYLASDVGRAALAAIPDEYRVLPLTSLATALRRDYAPGEAAALGEQLGLQAKARDRFGTDLGMRYSAAGLEMMTHPAVAKRRAERLATLDLPVADLTCGVGGDLRAVAVAGIRAVGLDSDAATATLAAANVPSADILIGDTAWPPLRISDRAIILDPARRSGVRRSFDPDAYSPQWDVALGLLGEAAAGVLKTAPGIEHERVPPSMEVEFVQHGRSLREAALWTGRGASAGLRRAVLLPSGATITSNEPESPADEVAPGAFLFDPESCVTRAGLVRHLAHRLGARMMDAQVAYLTADRPATDPLAASFEVLDAMPFSLARLRGRLRERNWRPHEIRRRAFPIEPDELRRLLGAPDGDPVTLICTTLADQRTIFIVRRVDR